MKHAFPAAICLAFSIATSAHADEVTDTLQSAMDAYNSGDLQYALEELEFAKQLMLTQKTDALSVFLPDAPEGWTREVNTEINASLGMMGGGVGAEARYSGGGQDFTLSIYADNPMVGAMAAMIQNAAAMGMKIERIGREKFAVQDNTLQGMIANRILVKAEGGEIETMKKVLETIDYKALAGFGQ